MVRELSSGMHCVLVGPCRIPWQAQEGPHISRDSMMSNHIRQSFQASLSFEVTGLGSSYGLYFCPIRDPRLGWISKHMVSSFKSFSFKDSKVAFMRRESKEPSNKTNRLKDNYQNRDTGYLENMQSTDLIL